MANRDIDPDFPPEPIGSDLYLWKYDPDAGAQQLDGCVISAHGCYKPGRKFDLPAGKRLHFYVDIGVNQPDFGLRNLILGKQPRRTVTGPANGYNYELSKYQGRHSAGEESYRSIVRDLNYIDEFNGMRALGGLAPFRPLDVVTVRNRFFGGTMTLQKVIQALPNYRVFYCFFCCGRG